MPPLNNLEPQAAQILRGNMYPFEFCFYLFLVLIGFEFIKNRDIKNTIYWSNLISDQSWAACVKIKFGPPVVNFYRKGWWVGL